MGLRDLRIHFTSLLPCEPQLSMFAICKVGIAIGSGNGQGLQSTTWTSVMEGLTLSKAPWERDVGFDMSSVFSRIELD